MKKEIFKKAHKVTKNIIKKGDNYRATFKLALSFVYSQVKKEIDTMQTVADKLIEKGYKIWENYGYKRIYLNNFIELAESYGIDLVNPKGYRGVSMYYDLTDDKFYTKGSTSSREATIDSVVSAIRKG